MASTAIPELIHRFPSTQTPQAQRRLSENIGGDGESGIGPMIGIYQRALSFTGDAAISSESETGDNCEVTVNMVGAVNSPVAAGHSIDVDEEDDGDDDVFDTTPAAVTVDTKNSAIIVNADGQYDDVS